MADELNKAPQDDGCLDWDDVIEDDGQEFIILPEGDYNFEVTYVERGRFPGSSKIPSCNKATITLQVKTEDGTASVRTDLLLHQKAEWKLAAFFRCIGQKKHGEKLKMNWNQVVGSQGLAHIKIRTYTDKDGNERKANDVSKFYDYDEKYFPPEKNDGFMKVPEGETLPWKD